jgi:hypothetical protein
MPSSGDTIVVLLTCNKLLQGKAGMKGCLWRGIVYSFLWYTSILCGFYTLCSPMLPVLLISHRAYRHIMDLIFAMWELYPVVSAVFRKHFF